METERRYRNLRILFVDDEPSIGACFKALVEASCRARVSVCYTANAALKELKGGNFDLLITDIIMPGRMDGLELAECAAEKYNIPIVLITGYAVEDVLPLGFDSNTAVCCLSKPYTLQDVEEKVREALKMKEGKKE